MNEQGQQRCFTLLKEYLQSVTKYTVKSKKLKQNWTIPDIFNVCFCIGFDHYHQ